MALTYEETRRAKELDIIVYTAVVGVIDSVDLEGLCDIAEFIYSEADDFPELKELRELLDKI